MKCPAVTLLLLLLATVPVAVLAQDDGEIVIKERELEQIREQISDLKKSMDRRAGQREQLTAELKAAEIRISETRLHLDELRAAKASSEKKVAELEGSIRESEALLAKETRQLADQVRAAYVSGRQERIRLLLNQQDPATLGRMLVYYRYLSDYRGDNIESVSARIEELDRLHRQAADERNRLAALASDRYEELTALSRAQQERQQLLAALQAKMAEEGSEIERLAAQEKDLSRLIAELASILSDYPITSDQPFRDMKGHLTWPIAGSLLHEFGQPRADGTMQWNGVVLAAPRGREVRSVYHGRVVFADWLDGLGLLVIIDHGEGFLTLYGYNETTMKSAGDWVAPGDVIATVGNSGGQPRSSLYFEIRLSGKPVNPRAWFSRRPSGS